MFLLILLNRYPAVIHVLDLHSTMFLLIRDLIDPNFKPGICIYIPLCFYLYVWRFLTFLTANFIYIPLCFYLYCLGSVRARWYSRFTFHYVSTYTASVLPGPGLSFIYIPLCFYLYDISSSQYDMLHLFTFHYVSTYTIIPDCILLPRTYIYIPLCFYLYLSKSCILQHDIFIYIPLCFYLYQFCPD